MRRMPGKSSGPFIKNQRRKKNVMIDLAKGQVAIVMVKQISTPQLAEALKDYPKYQISESNHNYRVTTAIEKSDTAKFTYDVELISSIDSGRTWGNTVTAPRSSRFPQVTKSGNKIILHGRTIKGRRLELQGLLYKNYFYAVALQYSSRLPRLAVLIFLACLT